MTNEERSTVFVVDDDASMREALKNLLRSMELNVETFGSAKEFLSSQNSKGPGCLVQTCDSPASGLDLQRQLTDANIQIPIIFITAHGDIQMSVRAIKRGQWSFSPKTIPRSGCSWTLSRRPSIGTVRTVCKGHRRQIRASDTNRSVRASRK